MFTVKGEAVSRVHPRLRGRRLILVDVENLAEGAVLSREVARRIRDSVHGWLTIGAPDQVIVAMSHLSLVNVGLEWAGARPLVRSGPDGADWELAAVLDYENVEQRYDEIVLVSGDGFFAERVSRLGGRGVSVTVVAVDGSCSKRLRLAALRCLTFSRSLLTKEAA